MTSSPPPLSAASPFHEGESLIQEKAGKRALVEKIGQKFIRPFLTEQQQEFFGNLSYLFLSVRDPEGWPLPTIMAGDVPLISVPDSQHMILHAFPEDRPNLHAGQHLGLLGLDFSNKRRNRVNGRVAALDGEKIIFRVDQAFGNCPQYIDIQDIADIRSPSAPPIGLSEMTPAIRNVIRRSIRFFIASGYTAHQNETLSGMDMSHRGGPPGFVQTPNARTLIFPDYAGNNFFNSLGNILMDGRAGLLFVDFDSGLRLRLFGKADVIFDNFEAVGWTNPEDNPAKTSPPEKMPKARRLVRLNVEKILYSPGT
tara:strand:- start:6949 stop:7881 length:933 start_codon:yes stop_codon:yes gene_type:complete